MEQFLLDHAKRHQELVKRFTPKTIKRNASPQSDLTTRDLLVATRIRPMLKDELSSGQVPAVFTRLKESGVIDLHELKRVVRGLPTLNSSCFQPGKVYSPDRTTEAIYKDMVQPLLPWAWDGNVGTLFAYGQTGSGKTFTVSRLEQLVAKSLFDGSLPGKRKVSVTIFELAGSSARDLLPSLQTGPATIKLIEDSLGEVQLLNAIEQEVSSAGELLQLIEHATAYRKTASTEKNDGSSRSHAVCRLRIQNPSPDALEDGYLYMIDLAGSEAARDMAEHSADRLKETREINASLSVLKDCIRSIAGVDSSTSKKPYVPFRQNILTKTLKHVFDPSGGRKCKTAVLACINPSFLDTGATKNTIRYAEMLLSAQPTNKPPGYNPNVPMTWTNKDLRSYIKTKSGNPSIAPYELAPKETGAQILRLPVEEFIQRCLGTFGVTREQAEAFHLKLWTLHLSSQRQQSLTTKNQERKPDPQGHGPLASNLTSRDPSQNRDSDFTKRVRPGMTVQWNPPADFPFLQKERNLAVVLCPQDAVGNNAIDVQGRQVQPYQSEGQGFLCALALPGTLGQSYEVHLWQQVVVWADQMRAEVILEYDPATRYYHVTV